MSVDERSRLQLAEALKRALGPDEGITLMELLPPVGWADVATKHDLHVLEGRVDARFDNLETRLDARFEALDARFEISEHKIVGAMDRELRNLTMKLFAVYGATVCTVLGAVIALIKL